MAFSSFNTLNQLTNKQNKQPPSDIYANILSTIQPALTLQYYFPFDISASGNTGTTLTNQATSSIYASNTAALKNSGGTTQQIQTVITNNTSNILLDPSNNRTNSGSFYVNSQYYALIGSIGSTATSTNVLTFPTVNNGNYTISIWCKISSCGSLQNVFGLNNNDQSIGSTILHLNIENRDVNNTVSGTYYKFSIFDYNLSSSYPVSFVKTQASINNIWNHVVYTVSISSTGVWTATIYFNRVAEASTTNLSANASNHFAYGIGIGHRSDNRDNYINGYVDNFRIYTSVSSGAISQASVDALYNAKA